VRQVRWTTEASDQLVAAVKRIQEDNPTAAQNVAQAVMERIDGSRARGRRVHEENDPRRMFFPMRSYDDISPPLYSVRRVVARSVRIARTAAGIVANSAVARSTNQETATIRGSPGFT